MGKCKPKGGKGGKGRSVLLAVVSALCAGCSSQGMISAAAVDAPFRAVMDRHDAYVQADATLADAQKQAFLRTSQIARAVLDAAKPAPVAAK